MKSCILALLFFLGLCTNLFPSTSPTGSPPPRRIGRFWTLAGDIQLLPGGTVVVRRGNAVVQYRFERGQFETFSTAIPPELSRWRFFDWEAVDYLDQIDKKDFDFDAGHLLPPGSKVKKVLKVPSPDRTVKMTLVCYSLPTTQEYPGGAQTDIFLLALNQIKHGNDPPRYEQRWLLKLKEEAAYGNLTLQELPGNGFWIAFYSAIPGGDSVSKELDIFELSLIR